MIKAFIFDIDGTLIDSNDFHAKAWEKALATQGKNISFQKIRPHLGKGSDQLLPEFLTKKEIEELGETISQSRGEIFKREYMPRIRPFPQVRELFKKIREAGVRLALASSSKKDEVEEYKTIAQIDDLVEKSTSADDAEESKPEPDIFQAAMNLLGNPPKNAVLVVGDTPYDAIAATKAKLPVIGVLCGGFSAKDLRAHGCRAIFQDPADLLQNLEKILKG
jgi:beta-phosphoglucomutase-like phosphatase (HAD superfamily)